MGQSFNRQFLGNGTTELTNHDGSRTLQKIPNALRQHHIVLPNITCINHFFLPWCINSDISIEADLVQNCI